MTGRPRFITLEGGEGSGKSTQALQIKAWLEMRGQQVLLTREPGGSPGAELIRALLVQGAGDRWDPLTEYLLFSAARRDHILRTIKPALASGTTVICDRFFDSSLVYQGRVQGLDLEKMRALYAWIADDLTPDITLVFDLDPRVGLARTQSRAGSEDRFEMHGLDFHDRVRAGYLALAQDAPMRTHVIDANQDPATVTRQILKTLEHIS